MIEMKYLERLSAITNCISAHGDGLLQFADGTERQATDTEITEAMTPPAPRTASRAQVLITLHEMGLYDAYMSYIATAPIPVQIAAGEPTWSLDSPNIQAGIAAMGLSPEQAQAIISQAVTVVV